MRASGTIWSWEATAQDAVQQAFLLAWRELPRLRDPERFEVWLHRLVVDACYEEFRRYRRWSANVRTLPVDGPAARDETVSIDDRDALERAFRTLSPEHRAVVVLHHHAGLPLASIAEVAGVPLGTGATTSRDTSSAPDLRLGTWRYR
jgi:RNA polymerase sigma-70 factor (ECF subfamily)